MLQVVKGATRLAAGLLVLGVSSAFGALYTFNLTSPSKTTGPTLTISSVEDVAVTVTLSTLAGLVGTDVTGGGVGSANLDIQNNERLIISPQSAGPFTLSTVSFGNVDTGSGTSGDEATVYLDGVSAGTFTLPGGGGPVAAGSVPGADTFNTSIAFSGSASDDDFRVTQIVLDINNATVPEPTTWTLFGAGVIALAWFRRKRA